MKFLRTLPAAMLLACAIPAAGQSPGETFPTSLHGTRAGKDYWYGAANGGFETFTGVPIADIGCVECHGPTDANGNAYMDPYAPGCADCHATMSDFSVSTTQCYGCHGRQKTEDLALGYTDVHRDSGNPAVDECWDCHSSSEMHGDGTPYQSMLEPGAMTTDCTDCHVLDPSHDTYNPPSHNGKVHCTACHTQSVVSCYNCHFESQVVSHKKRALRPLNNFLFLVNREKDGKVYSGTFQSLTYEGDSFVAFAPYTAHTITANGRGCAECHVNFGGSNPTILEYNANTEIKFAEWDDVNKVLTHKQGIVPIPRDYEVTLKMDFLTYTGDTNNPPGPDFENWTGIGEDTPDGQHMLFATPLSWQQMAKLGFVNLCFPDTNGDRRVNVDDLNNVILDWGTDGSANGGDIVGTVPGSPPDGIVNVNDLNEIIVNWGLCL